MRGTRKDKPLENTCTGREISKTKRIKETHERRGSSMRLANPGRNIPKEQSPRCMERGVWIFAENRDLHRMAAVMSERGQRQKSRIRKRKGTFRRGRCWWGDGKPWHHHTGRGDPEQ